MQCEINKRSILDQLTEQQNCCLKDKNQKMEKIDLFIETSDMICDEVVQCIKIEKTCITLKNFEDLWKE